MKQMNNLDLIAEAIAVLKAERKPTLNDLRVLDILDFGVRAQAYADSIGMPHLGASEEAATLAAEVLRANV